MGYQGTTFWYVSRASPKPMHCVPHAHILNARMSTFTTPLPHIISLVYLLLWQRSTFSPCSVGRFVLKDTRRRQCSLVAGVTHIPLKLSNLSMLWSQ